MSRHSASSKNRNTYTQTMDNSAEDLVEQSKSIVSALNEIVATRHHEWQTYVVSARSAMTALDHVRFFRDPSRFVEQVWLLNGLQDFAFHDPDSGCIQEIAEWCQTAWLRILRNFPENVETLTGLGRNWLQRAQATLARIHREEGNDSSSQGSAKFSSGTPPTDPRRQGPLYVEARGYLQPAVDFYTRAVRSADSLGTTTGDLLASTAEAQMSLGNVTASPQDERHFLHAVRYLRRAEALPNYRLSHYLQQYLNDYGRYVN